MPKVTLDFDAKKYEELLAIFDFSPEKLTTEVKETLAIMLFRSGKISLGKAAELADLSLAEILERLEQLGIPAYKYEAEDWAVEKKGLRRLRNEGR
jgi:predicted HTH domain antitoxin